MRDLDFWGLGGRGGAESVTPKKDQTTKETPVPFVFGESFRTLITVFRLFPG